MVVVVLTNPSSFHIPPRKNKKNWTLIFDRRITLGRPPDTTSSSTGPTAPQQGMETLGETDTYQDLYKKNNARSNLPKWLGWERREIIIIFSTRGIFFGPLGYGGGRIRGIKNHVGGTHVLRGRDPPLMVEKIPPSWWMPLSPVVPIDDRGFECLGRTQYIRVAKFVHYKIRNGSPPPSVCMVVPPWPPKFFIANLQNCFFFATYVCQFFFKSWMFYSKKIFPGFVGQKKFFLAFTGHGEGE